MKTKLGNKNLRKNRERDVTDQQSMTNKKSTFSPLGTKVPPKQSPFFIGFSDSLQLNYMELAVISNRRVDYYYHQTVMAFIV